MGLEAIVAIAVSGSSGSTAPLALLRFRDEEGRFGLVYGLSVEHLWRGHGNGFVRHGGRRDIATHQLKRRSEATKNELMRETIDTCIRNELKFRFVPMDSWFSATENFDFIVGKGRHFIAALKDNRLIAVTEQDRKKQPFSARRGTESCGANRRAWLVQGLSKRSPCAAPGLYKQGRKHG